MGVTEGHTTRTLKGSLKDATDISEGHLKRESSTRPWRQEKSDEGGWRLRGAAGGDAGELLLLPHHAVHVEGRGEVLGGVVTILGDGIGRGDFVPHVHGQRLESLLAVDARLRRHLQQP